MEVTGRTRLSVLIPTHGRPALLGRTLESLSKCAIPHGYAETVVIENGPKSGAEGVVSDASVMYPRLRIRYMHVERANKSHALNEALKTIGEGLVVFFDDDIRVDPGLLEAYTSAAISRPMRAFFGGAMESDFEVRPPSWLLPLLPASVQGFALTDVTEASTFLGANWAAYTSDLRAVGGFDPNFGPGSPTGARGQETEMQRRLRQIGVVAVYVNQAVVRHFVPRERCTVKWAARRRFDDGKTYGLECLSIARWRFIGGEALGAARGLLVAGKRLLLRDARGAAISGLAVCKRAGAIVGYVQARSKQFSQEALHQPDEPAPVR